MPCERPAKGGMLKFHQRLLKYVQHEDCRRSFAFLSYSRHVIMMEGSGPCCRAQRRKKFRAWPVGRLRYTVDKQRDLPVPPELASGTALGFLRTCVRLENAW